jgi:hypothetical protein
MAGGVIAALLYKTIRVPGPLISAKQAEQALPTHREERRQNNP